MKEAGAKRSAGRYALIGLVLLFTIAGVTVHAADLYFPSPMGVWQTVKPADAGWDADKLSEALEFAGASKSSGVVVLHNGRILTERHWQLDGARLKQGQTTAGHSVEDVASVQKSVVSILVGIAQERGLLAIDDPVNKHLGKRWSRATTEQEGAITIRHLLTMISGLSVRAAFKAPAGTSWQYNTPIYARTVDLLETASGLDRHKLTEKWLTEPLGMADSRWVPRGTSAARQVNGFGFATSARDLARFGLMMLAQGSWAGNPVIKDVTYLQAATSSSQELNPYYGYLWWVNRNAFTGAHRLQLDSAPIDLIAANGALSRHCYVVPSLGLVVTRLGEATGEGFAKEFWRLLMAAGQ